MSSSTRRHLKVAQPDANVAAEPAGVAAAGVVPTGVTPADGAATENACATDGGHRVYEKPGIDGAGDEARLIQVGDLAKATGKTVRALHLYEDMGLIVPERRSKGRYRLYSSDAKVRVRWISKLQSLGLSLPEIQAIVHKRQASDSARRAADELRGVYVDKLQEVRSNIAELRALEQELEASVTFLETCHHSCTTDVAMTGCDHCTRHPEQVETPPDLIVGAHMDAALLRATRSRGES